MLTSALSRCSSVHLARYMYRGNYGYRYPDEGSAYSTWTNNVVSSIGRSEWLHLWTGSIHDIVIKDNYADTARNENHGKNCPMINNTIFAPNSPPPAAVAIMNASGVDRAANPWASTLV